MHYQKYLRQSTYRRYGIFVFTFFFLYYGIQSYLNNINIEFSIEQTKQGRIDTQEKITYLEKFYSPYLTSPLAAYFLSHENGSLYKNERIVRIKYRTNNNVTNEQLPLQANTKGITLSTPQASREYFITTKLSELASLGILPPQN